MPTTHQLVAVVELDGDQTGLERRVVGGEEGLLDPALAGGEEQEPVGLVVAGVDDGLDVLVALELQQVDQGQYPARCGW